MAEIVEMIQLSPTMEEGILVEWLKQEGDTIASGDLLAEVETDKATMEMESYYEGVLLKLLVKDGDSAPVGSAIAIVGEEGENIDDLLAEIESGGGSAESKPDDGGDEEESGEEDSAGDDVDEESEDESEEDEGSEPEDSEGDGDTGEAQEEGDQEEEDSEDDSKNVKSSKSAKKQDGERILASPVARKLAEEQNINLAQIEGSGPAGRIVKNDVQQAIDSGSAKKGTAQKDSAKKSGKSSKPDPSGKQKTAKPAVNHGGEDVKLTPMRKSIAKTLTEAWKAPAFMLTRTVTMDRTIEFRKRLNERLEANDEPRISINDIIIKACATALAAVPEMNASFEGDHIHLYEHANIGFAVAIDGGLITPIVAAAETLGLRDISAQTRELAERARNKKLKPEEFTGSSFSISNLGMFGIEHFTAVLNPPGAGILAVGTIRKEPVYEGDQLVPRHRMSITLTCDHRAVDGALGAQFLDHVATYLDDPTMMLS